MTSNGSQLLSKVTGYLEKKGRLRIGSLWKKYWFVLEGRLLLYYRSKDEYEAISPCKGSINLCPPCTIKPAAATSCIFQVVGRATTVTLRAESRYEQERWMQALLMAIDQTKPSPSRLSHFRYSLDELPKPYQENEIPQNKLQRQHSMTYNTSTPKRDIIGRLQLIGAHTYGGSLDTISKISITQNEKPNNNKHNGKSFSNKSLRNGSAEIVDENNQYSIIQEENSLDILIDTHNYKALSLDQIKNIKDKSLSKLNGKHMVENETYLDTNKTKRTRNKKLRKSESLYERMSSDSHKFSVVKLRRKNSNIYERISNSFNGAEKHTKLNNFRMNKQSLESLRFEPEYTTLTNLHDHNKNSLIIDNDQYLQGFDNTNNDEYSKVDQIKEELEELYEDLDAFQKPIDFEPALPPRPTTKKLPSSDDNSTNSSLDKNRNKKRKGLNVITQLIKSERKIETSNNTTGPKKKRSTSFIHRILRKKEKPVDTTEDIIYSVIENNIEKPKNVNDIEMLQELQKILESRKTLLKKKLQEGNAQNTKIHTINEIESPKTVQVVIEERPSLPPRQNSQTSIVHNHQPTNLTNTIEPVAKDAVNNHTNTENNQIKTIDEIIEDLDREKDGQDPNHKVKNLIEKFNDLHNEDEILLRKRPKSNLQRSETVSGAPLYPKLNFITNNNKDSDELTNLLNELSKVTSAPILTPGVTSSLTNPVVGDEEWEQVIPLRYRRLSDPDYDVPRPHSLLQLQNRLKPLPKNAIQATRFFGPALQSSDQISSEPPSLSSIDLDSLEIDHSLHNITNVKQSNLSFKYGEKDGSISSYKSHNYTKLDVPSFEGKPILSNTKLTFENSKISTPSPVSEEIFIDSLEPVIHSTYF